MSRLSIAEVHRALIAAMHTGEPLDPALFEKSARPRECRDQLEHLLEDIGGERNPRRAQLLTQRLQALAARGLFEAEGGDSASGIVRDPTMPTLGDDVLSAAPPPSPLPREERPDATRDVLSYEGDTGQHRHDGGSHPAPGAPQAQREPHHDTHGHIPVPQCPADRPHVGHGPVPPPHTVGRKAGQWAYVPPEVDRLAGVLTGTEWVVLIKMLRATNWKEARQGGLPAMFTSDEAMARGTPIKRPHVCEARNRIMDLGIYRDATPKEAAAVLAELQRNNPDRRGRPPGVRVLVDPAHWRLPTRREGVE